MINRQHTTPLIISDNLGNYQNAQKLEKISLGLSGDQKFYDENWLQNLIFKYPSLLPIEELEPAFFPLYPVARELKTQAGYLDNLYVSEKGGLTLVECKLWRNPARIVITSSAQVQVLTHEPELHQGSVFVTNPVVVPKR